MRSRTAFGRSTVFACLTVLVLAGCGSTHSTTATAKTLNTQPGVTSYVPPPPARPATYTIKLTGTITNIKAPAGAPNGSGTAVITFNTTTGQLCWKFSQLNNVTAPKVARIYQGFENATGAHGRPLGRVYTPSGCLAEPSILFSLIEAHTERFYLAIFNDKYPEGAVRGQF